MGKSSQDASRGALRTMLQYKCDEAGVRFKEVDERYSTQDCSTCGTRARPKGRECPAVRSWQHPCDVKAAINMRNRGRVWLRKQFATSAEREQMKLR